MPGVMLFGRRCHFASDDLLLPALYGITLHFSWACLAVYLLVHVPASCPQRSWLQVYLSLCVTVFCVELAAQAIMGWLSLRGSVADDRPRRPVVAVIYAFMVLAVIELTLHAFALAMYHSDTQTCPDRIAYMSLFIVVVYVFLTALLAFAIALLAQIAVGSRGSSIDRIDSPRFWQYCLAPLVCFPLYFRKDGRRAQSTRPAASGTILNDIAALFSDMFGDVQLVPSDVLVGLMLVKEQQLKSRRSARMSGRFHSASRSSVIEHLDDTLVLTASSSSDPPQLHRDWKSIVHFYEYADAIYGFPLY
eukprot:jgi/Hompol1/5546/HPOL_004526-RA